MEFCDFGYESMEENKRILPHRDKRYMPSKSDETGKMPKFKEKEKNLTSQEGGVISQEGSVTCQRKGVSCQRKGVTCQEENASGILPRDRGKAVKSVVVRSPSEQPIASPSRIPLRISTPRPASTSLTHTRPKCSHQTGFSIPMSSVPRLTTILNEHKKWRNEMAPVETDSESRQPARYLALQDVNAELSTSTVSSSFNINQDELKRSSCVMEEEGRKESVLGKELGGRVEEGVEDQELLLQPCQIQEETLRGDSADADESGGSSEGGQRDADEAVDGGGEERVGRQQHRQETRRKGEKPKAGDTSIPRGEDDADERRRGGQDESPGRRSPSPRVQAPRRRLIIEIDPTKWGITDKREQTGEGCVNAFLGYYNDLFGQVQNKAIDWTQQDCQQFLACVVVRLADRRVPGGCQENEFDDLCDYNADGSIKGSRATFDPGVILCGVNHDNTENYFNPVGRDKRTVGNLKYITTRLSYVIGFEMLEDLRSRNIDIEVQYKYGERANGEQMSVTYDADLIYGSFYDGIEFAVNGMNKMYEFQCLGLDLAGCIDQVAEERLDELEVILGNNILHPEANDDDLRKESEEVLEAIVEVKRSARRYDNLGTQIYRASGLQERYVTGEIQNQQNLSAFLKNSGESFRPWIREPRKWCAFTTNCKVGDVSLSIMNNPSRFYLPPNILQLDRVVNKAKDLVDRCLNHIKNKDHNVSFPRHSSPIKGGGGGVDDAKKVTYPDNLVADGKRWLHEVSGKDLENCSLTNIESTLRMGTDLLRELKQYQWRHCITLKSEDQNVEGDMRVFANHLAEVIKENQEAQKIKDIEARELSKSITAAKPPFLDSNGNNVQNWLAFHNNFKQANGLSRCIRIRESIPAELKERVIHETDPEKILELVKRMYLCEDVLFPLAKKSLEILPDNVPINSKQEGKAFTTIMNFVAKLEKEKDFLEKFDFSTIALATRKMSRQRQDEWEKSWIIEQQKIEDKPLRYQEDVKRKNFLTFVKLHETLLNRRLLQQGLGSTDKDKDKEKEKEKKKFVFATQEADPRKTRFDKKAEKNKKESRRAGEEESGKQGEAYSCKCCGKAGGHPKFFPASQAGRSRTSLARCPKFKAHEDKLALIKSLKACKMCLSTTHTHDKCLLDPSTPWLLHECGDSSSKDHNPVACPFKPTTPENSNKVSDEKNFKSKKTRSKTIVNIMESMMCKKGDKDGEEQINVVFDGCSDSHWCSESFAATLPQETKKKVELDLKTIPSKGVFSTFEYTIKIKCRDKFVPIQVYAAKGEVGSTGMKDKTARQLYQEVGVPFEVVRGPVHLLLGLQDFHLHPMLYDEAPSTTFPNIRLFKSATSQETKYIIGGSIVAADRGVVGNETRANFTTNELHKLILNQQGPDLPPKQCNTCRLRSRKCYKCSLMAHPLSPQQQRETELILKPMKFNEEEKKVTTHFIPVTSTFQELFPPELSNENEALTIAKKHWKRLKKNGHVELFEEAFQKSVDNKVFLDLPLEEMDAYDEAGNPSNFCAVFGVPKNQTDESKLSYRLVCHASLNRRTNLHGKIVRLSLNAVLPKSAPVMNSLVNIVLRWIVKPCSLVFDQKRAYQSVHTDENTKEGLITRNLRRIVWFENAKEAKHETDLKPRIMVISPINWGEAPSAMILDVFRSKIVQNLKNRGHEKWGQELENGSFVDDSACSLETIDDAIKFYKEAKKEFENYGAELHEPIVSDKHGRYDEDGNRMEISDETVLEEKLFGLYYNGYEDTIRLPIQRSIFKKKGDLTSGPDLHPDDIDKLKVTMRVLASYLMQIFDFMGWLTCLLIRGKICLMETQRIFSPAKKENWDKELPPQLLTEAREFIKMMLTSPDPVLKRNPPSGTLEHLHIFVDGGKNCFGAICYGVWVDNDDKRGSKLLFARTKVATLTIPRMELSAFNLGVQIATNITKIVTTIKKCYIYGDSESTQLMIEDEYKPRDVFCSNRVSNIHANIQEMEEADIEVKTLLVRSESNLADPISKWCETSKDLVNSQLWWEGPEYLKEDEHSWPVVKINRQTKKTDEEVCKEPERKFCEHPTWSLKVEEEDKSETDNEIDAGAITSTTDDIATTATVTSTTAGPTSSSTSTSTSTSTTTAAAGDQTTADGTSTLPVVSTDDDNVTTMEPAVTTEASTSSRSSTASLSLSTTIADEDDDEEEAGDEKSVKTDYAFFAAKQTENTHVFSRLITRMSNVNKVCRVVARIYQAFKKKSFKVKSPTVKEEVAAFKILVKMEQESNKPKVPKNLSIFKEDGLLVSSQRYEEDVHIDLFGVRALPILSVGSQLSQRVLERAHKGADGVCRGNKHALLEVRTGKYKLFVIEGAEKYLNKIRSSCVRCLQRGGKTYQPQIKIDRFKNNNLKPFQSISIDVCGPTICQEKGKETRSRKIHHKRYILGITDNSGYGCCNFVLLRDASSDALVVGLMTHVHEVGQQFCRVFSDRGGNILCVGKRDNERAKDKTDKEDYEDKIEMSVEKFEKSFPGVIWECSTSYTPWADGLQERNFGIMKRYIRDILNIKKLSPLPIFTFENLQLILKMCKAYMNKRPLTWLKDREIPLCPASFLAPQDDNCEDMQSWFEPKELMKNYQALEEYRERIIQFFREEKQLGKFSSEKWPNAKDIPLVGDICLHIWKKSKCSPGISEYGRITKVSPDGRKITLIINRRGSKQEIEISSRNAICILKAKDYET